MKPSQGGGWVAARGRSATWARAPHQAQAQTGALGSPKGGSGVADKVFTIRDGLVMVPARSMYMRRRGS